MSGSGCSRDSSCYAFEFYTSSGGTILRDNSVWPCIKVHTGGGHGPKLEIKHSSTCNYGYLEIFLRNIPD